MCSKPEFKWCPYTKCHNRPSYIPTVRCFEHFTAWWIYLMLSTKGIIQCSWQIDQYEYAALLEWQWQKNWHNCRKACCTATLPIINPKWIAFLSYSGISSNAFTDSHGSSETYAHKQECLHIWTNAKFCSLTLHHHLLWVSVWEYLLYIYKGYKVAQLVEELRYKPGGCGFQSGQWDFSLT